MFLSSLLGIAIKLDSGTYSESNPIIVAYQERHLDIVRSALEMWSDCGNDESFIEYFQNDFPPGYIQRDVHAAKQIIENLMDIARGSAIRYKLRPIYTYVMYHLIDDFLESLHDYEVDGIDIGWLFPDELVKYLRKANANKDQRKYIKLWFTDYETCAEDFLDTYNSDFTSSDFAEQVADMYLYDLQGINKLKILGVDITDFFDLLPNDLKEQCIETYKCREQKNEDLMKYDFFISHASEDKLIVAEPLAQALEILGAKVWLDRFELKIGDSLRESIDMGLRDAKKGIVILSEVYFQKFWTKKELNALFAKSVDGEKIILPVRHNISVDEVAHKSLLLADIFSLSTSENTIEEIARQIIKTM